MTDAPAPNLRIKALELANNHPETASKPPAAAVERANAYHAYLTGVDAPKPTGTTAAAPKAGATATAPKPAAAPKAGATAPKPGAAASKPGSPAASKSGATNPPAGGGTSADGLVMEDVTRALQKVLNAGINPKADADTKAKQKEVGKKRAYKILLDVAGADSARNVKPEKYRAVIDACEAAVKAPAPKPAAAPAAEPDDFGATADDGADGAAGEAGEAVAGDDEVDPPEHTGAGEDA